MKKIISTLGEAKSDSLGTDRYGMVKIGKVPQHSGMLDSVGIDTCIL